MSTPEQLAGLAYLVSSGNSLENVTVRLGADVDMSAHEWIPIGTSQIPFKGVLDGCGHTISGLRVSVNLYAGLVGYARNAEIRNVMLASDCQMSGRIAGSIVGQSENCIIENCVSEAQVSGFYTGGFAGNSDNTSFGLCLFNGTVSKMVSDSWNGIFLGPVTQGNNMGQQNIQMNIAPVSEQSDTVNILLIGSQNVAYSFYGTIGDDGLLHIPMGQYLGENEDYSLYLYGLNGTTAFAEGEFVGTLSNNNQTLTVSVSSEFDALGVLGTQDWSSIYAIEWLMLPFSISRYELSSVGTFTGGGGYGWDYCYYRDDCAPEAGVINGMAQTTEQMQSSSLVETLNEGVRQTAEENLRSSFNLWRAGESGPVLSESVYETQSWWSEGNYDTSWYKVNQSQFVLTTPQQLAGLSYLVSHSITTFAYCTIKLGADIDLSACQWIPIGDYGAPFKGLFDGCGHTISGLHTGVETYAGLFGVIASGEVRNLYLDSSCRIQGKVVGSIVGMLETGSIMNCRCDATLQGSIAGGLVGIANNVSLLSSIFNGQVSAMEFEEWEGSYLTSISSAFDSNADTQNLLQVTIAEAAGSRGGYSLSLYSAGTGNIYEMTGYLGSDGKLHIPIQTVSTPLSTQYVLKLEGNTNYVGEFEVTLSGDKSRITFASQNYSIMLFAMYDSSGSSMIGYTDGWNLPFDVLRQESQVVLGGLVGSQYNVTVGNSAYRSGCLPDGVSDNEYALSQGELLSQSQVTVLNEGATAIVDGDPWVESLSRWSLGANGPEFGDGQLVATDWWISEGNYDISWYDSAQTEFTLSTPEQLAGLAYLVNSGTTAFGGKKIMLNNDIDLSGHRWVPVGRNYWVFYGTIDGNGHTIHHMEIDITAYSHAKGSTTQIIGFVGYLLGKMENLTLADDCSLRVVAKGSQNIYLGAVCGAMGGVRVNNCHNYAPVSAQALYGDVYSAGIVGFNTSYEPTYNSSNRGAVSAESEFGGAWAAGLASANSSLLNCYNAGNVSSRGHSAYVGGISAAYSNQQNVYHTGSLTATGLSSDPENPSTVVVSPLGPSKESEIVNGYYDIACVADTTGLNVKGIAMQASEMKTAAFAQQLTSEATDMMTNDPGIPALLSWGIVEGENGGYPVFGAAIEQGGWWTSEGNYDISWYDEEQTEFTLSTPEQLAGLSYLTKQGHGFVGKTVALAGDIDLAGLKWEAIGAGSTDFMGTFDGGGHEVHNLQCEISSVNYAYAGLFGRTSYAHISNVVLADDCLVKSTTYAGGIVAYAFRTEMESCVNRATVMLESASGSTGGIMGFGSVNTVDRCKNQGEIKGTVVPSESYSGYSIFVGGLVGMPMSTSTIVNSVNEASVTLDSNLGNGSNVGGLVGYSTSTTSIMNSYNTGDVVLEGSGCAGGILGNSQSVDMPIENCYNTGTVVAEEGSAFPIAPDDCSVTGCYYLTGCVGAGNYLGTMVGADEMKSDSFVNKLNSWSLSYNSVAPEIPALYWAAGIDDNKGYPILTEEKPGGSGVEAVESGVSIYPAVVTDRLCVRGAEQTIYLYNLAGHVVSVTEPVEETTIVDMSRLPQGIYLVRAGEQVFRVVKQ